jgi:phage terminase small subunit
MRKFTGITALLALCLGAAFGQEKKEKTLALKDLAPAVQKTIQAELKGGQIKSIGKETEDGVDQYEVETMLNGKHRDFNVDTKGKLLLVEEETSIDSIPAAAKGAILKKVADGKLGMVELFMRGGETMYEAGYTTKVGKKHEVLVKADGTETKD